MGSLAWSTGVLWGLIGKTHVRQSRLCLLASCNFRDRHWVGISEASQAHVCSANAL